MVSENDKMTVQAVSYNGTYIIYNTMRNINELRS